MFKAYINNVLRRRRQGPIDTEQELKGRGSMTSEAHPWSTTNAFRPRDLMSCPFYTKTNMRTEMRLTWLYLLCFFFVCFLFIPLKEAACRFNKI